MVFGVDPVPSEQRQNCSDGRGHSLLQSTQQPMPGDEGEEQKHMGLEKEVTSALVTPRRSKSALRILMVFKEKTCAVFVTFYLIPQ